MKILLVNLFLMFFLLSGGSYAQQSQHLHEPHAHRHKEHAKKKNPIPMTAQTIDKGRNLFGKHCVSCHGEEGKGPLDLTDHMFIHGDSDGEIFHVITDGVRKSKMKAFQKELTDEMRWQLVNYIKSVSAGAKAAARPGKQIREIEHAGYTLKYHLLDIAEREKMMKGMDDHSIVRMRKVPDRTNHLMIYIQKPDGTIVPGNVAFLMRGPDGRDFNTRTMGMYGGYGADLDLKLKGVYTIRSKIAAGSGKTQVKLDDEFTFQVN
jgi:cytochrome c553